MTTPSDEQTATLATVWFAEELLGELGEPGALLLLEQVQSGDVSLDELDSMRASSRRAEAGEFGMELGASMLVALLTSALKPVFDKYVEKLTSKLVDKAADKTIDVVKRAFLGNLRGGDDGLTFEEIKGRLEVEQKSLGLSKKELERVLAALEKQQVQR